MIFRDPEIKRRVFNWSLTLIVSLIGLCELGGINNKFLALWIVLITTALFLWLAVNALKANLILKFEDGLSRNYLLVGHDLDDKTEMLFFGFRHLDIGQVLFLIVCWAIRKANPKVSLNEIRLSTVIPNADIHVGEVASLRRRITSSQSNADHNIGNCVQE